MQTKLFDIKALLGELWWFLYYVFLRALQNHYRYTLNSGKPNAFSCSGTRQQFIGCWRVVLLVAPKELLQLGKLPRIVRVVYYFNRAQILNILNL
jgi:hypothetical protein